MKLLNSGLVPLLVVADLKTIGWVLFSWGFHSSWMWHHITQWLVPDFSTFM